MVALELTNEDGYFWIIFKINRNTKRCWNNILWPQIPRIDNNEPCADMESKVQRFKRIGRSSERNNKFPTLEMLDFTFHIGTSTPTFFYILIKLQQWYIRCHSERRNHAGQVEKISTWLHFPAALSSGIFLYLPSMVLSLEQQ